MLKNPKNIIHSNHLSVLIMHGLTSYDMIETILIRSFSLNLDPSDVLSKQYVHIIELCM